MPLGTLSRDQRSGNMRLNSWDDIMDHLDTLPAWQQYAINQRLMDAVRTAEQLAAFGCRLHPNPCELGMLHSIRK
jgi:hypothetical protein